MLWTYSCSSNTVEAQLAVQTAVQAAVHLAVHRNLLQLRRRQLMMSHVQRTATGPELCLRQLESDQVKTGSGRPTLAIVHHVQQVKMAEGLRNQTAHGMQRQICRLFAVSHFWVRQENHSEMLSGSLVITQLSGLLHCVLTFNQWGVRWDLCMPAMMSIQLSKQLSSLLYQLSIQPHLSSPHPPKAHPSVMSKVWYRFSGVLICDLIVEISCSKESLSNCEVQRMCCALHALV